MMANNIFETLYVLFKGDTSDLKKSTEDAVNSTKKLQNSISSIDKASDHIGGKFLGFSSRLIEAAAAFASIHSVISGLSNAVNYDIQLGNASRALGVNVEQLDAWDNAIQRTGGTAEGFQGSLRSLADHFHTTAKVAMQALPQLADVFSHINRYSAFTYGKSIGLDEPTILLLQQGRREVESVLKKQKELGVVTQQQIEISRNYNNSLVDLKHAFRTLFNEIAIPALPGIQKLFETITKGVEYLTRHKDVVIGFLTTIAATVGIITLGLIIAGGWISVFIGGILLVASVIGLLYEDTKRYFNGQSSMLGDAIEKWKHYFNVLDEGWKEVTQDIVDYLNKFALTRAAVDFFKQSSSNFQNASQGKSLFELASQTPLNSQTSNSVLNSSLFNRNFTINSMPIRIETQATDAEGIAASIGLTFQDHFGLANNFFATNQYA